MGYQVKKSEMSLDFDGQLDYETWAKIGKEVGKDTINGHFYLGDWIKYGEGKFGEMYAQAIEDTGLGYNTLAHIKHVCQAIPAENRVPGLSFSHHRVVARLDPKKQKDWLSSAKAEGWSVHELRFRIRETLGKMAKVKCPHCKKIITDRKKLSQIRLCVDCRDEIKGEKE